MPTTGEKPGKGTYVCKKCGQKVVLDDKIKGTQYLIVLI